MPGEAFTANSLGFPSPRRIGFLAQQWSSQNDSVGQLLLPEFKHNMPFFEWDEEEGVAGMTNVSAMDADAVRIAQEALNTYREDPFVFKERAWLNEGALLRVRMAGTLDKMAGQTAVVKMQRRLNMRLDVRLAQQRWATLTGSNAIAESGVHRTVNWGIQTPGAPSTTWDQIATATPVDNLQGWLGLFDGVSEGGVRVFYGRNVANALAQNAQIRDLAKHSGFSKSIGITNTQVSALVSQFVGDIDSMQMYQAGYRNASKVFTPYIHPKKIVMVATPPMGQPLGNYITTPTIKNGGIGSPQGGRYSVPLDKIQEEGRYGMEVGYHGIPILFFPLCILVVQVLA